MANRRLSRSIVLQTLFEWDSGDATLTHDTLFERLKSYADEFGASEGDMPFMQELLKTVLAKQTEIDTVIEKAAPEWPLSKIATIDRNILRIGLAELLYADKAQVPGRVAINEAIELAKQFGSEKSSSFVNGVLGAVYEELGGAKNEPQVAAKREQQSPEKMPLEKLVGAVVYAREGDAIYLALVHDIFGHWTLSKGKLTEGESLEDGVRRKVQEETGLIVSNIEEEIGENEYIANDSSKKGGKKRRHATYFLAEAPFQDLILKKEGGLDDAQWFPLQRVGDLNFYDDVLPIITNAITILAQKKH